MERKLPVYLVVDTSFSMRGAPIANLQQGLRQMVTDLRGDPQALETVWLSIITFATGAEVVAPLTDVLQFNLPEIAAKGKSDMGAGLKLLLERIDREITRSSDSQKGDWRPTAFLLSDGGPSDSWIKPAAEVRARHDNGSLCMIAVGFGTRVHEDKLARVTPYVLVNNSEESEAFAKFLKWVSTSVSRSVQTNMANHNLISAAPLPSGFAFKRELWGIS